MPIAATAKFATVLTDNAMPALTTAIAETEMFAAIMYANLKISVKTLLAAAAKPATPITACANVRTAKYGIMKDVKKPTAKTAGQLAQGAPQSARQAVIALNVKKTAIAAAAAHGFASTTTARPKMCVKMWFAPAIRFATATTACANAQAAPKITAAVFARHLTASTAVLPAKTDKSAINQPNNVRPAQKLFRVKSEILYIQIFIATKGFPLIKILSPRFLIHKMD